ncbi:hypothetical protein LJC56_05655 [Christensenellaceae bacterium OttesenSCG-928-K19]|nr:hypothetical protein [Christensenellaceae bacterium OttesenSCG-928-K19]
MKELNKAETERRSNLIEIIVVVLLGITAVATAWSSWQEGLHGSQQDQKYTMANNLNAEANSMYNEGMQSMSQDLMIWNELSELHIDYAFAEEKGDMEEMEKLEYKIDQVMTDSVEPYPEFAAAIEWADAQEEYASPFDDQAFVDSYFAASSEKFDEAEAILEAGNANNTHGDHQGLVSVIYAVVLFLLGITSTFKQLTAKYVLLGVSGVGFVIATVFMFTIPIVMP